MFCRFPAWLVAQRVGLGRVRGGGFIADSARRSGGWWDYAQQTTCWAMGAGNRTVGIAVLGLVLGRANCQKNAANSAGIGSVVRRPECAGGGRTGDFSWAYPATRWCWRFSWASFSNSSASEESPVNDKFPARRRAGDSPENRFASENTLDSSS